MLVVCPKTFEKVSRVLIFSIFHFFQQRKGKAAWKDRPTPYGHIKDSALTVQKSKILLGSI